MVLEGLGLVTGMTGPTMSIFQGSHRALSQPNLFKNEFKSEIKSKLGFSIDSIVGHTTTSSSPPASPPRASWSPSSERKRPRSPSSPCRSPPSSRPRSRSPPLARSVSPPRQSSPTGAIYRPTPTSPTLAQNYLDQLASLKAFYEAKGNPGGHPLLPPGLSLPPGLPLPPRLPSNMPPFMHHPPSLPGPLHHHSLPPREYPLHPWFINRHRFPLGPNFPEFLLPFRKPKRIRTAFSPNQLLKLEQAFEKNQYVVGQERKELAKTLNLSETQVKVWFQNRRTKHKREETETEQMGRPGGAGGGAGEGAGGAGGQQVPLEDSGEEEEDIDCE